MGGGTSDLPWVDLGQTTPPGLENMPAPPFGLVMKGVMKNLGMKLACWVWPSGGLASDLASSFFSPESGTGR